MILCDIVMSREQRASATTTRRSRSTRAPISNDMQNRDEVRQHLLLVMICRILDRDEVRQQKVLIPPTMFQPAQPISRFLRLTMGMVVRMNMGMSMLLVVMLTGQNQGH